MPVQHRVQRYRDRMRERGYRPIQIWVPDVHSEEFAREAARQSALSALADQQGDDMAFVEAITAPWDDDEWDDT